MRGRDQTLTWLLGFQIAWFVACPAVLFYLAGTKTLGRSGVSMAWYHHVGLVLASLLSSLAFGALVLAAFATMGLVVRLFVAVVASCRRLLAR